MAAPRKKQVKKYKFELTRGAIGGIAIVCFCLFLWMFLLGVWTGQSLLMPSSAEVLDSEEDYQEILQVSEQKRIDPIDLVYFENDTFTYTVGNTVICHC